MKPSLKKKSIDMLHGALTSNLIFFAIPIALSSMLQQLFNAADTSVVGHFANGDALAAVGTNGEIVALLVTLSAGLATGANVLIAKYIGENRIEHISGTLHTALRFALFSGICGALLGQFISHPLLTAIQTPTDILDSAILYLRIYFIGYPFLMLYDFGSAILRAKGDSRRPFLALTLSGIINVGLNLFFVIVCHLGVSGVAIATDIATALSAGLVLFWLHQETDAFHLSLHVFLSSTNVFTVSVSNTTLSSESGNTTLSHQNLHTESRQTQKYLLPILATGIPAAIQGAVFCFANIFVQASVNSFGTIATAGSTIAMNFEYFGYYMITAFGQAATTFTSQNFAADNRNRCRQILTRCLMLSVLFSALITVPLTIWRFEFSALFSSDQSVIEAAALRIMLILLFEPICSFYETPAGSLRGCGHSTLPAVLTVLGTCVLRIVWIFTVFANVHTLESLFIVFPISWVVTILLVWIGFLFVKPFQRNALF